MDLKERTKSFKKSIPLEYVGVLTGRGRRTVAHLVEGLGQSENRMMVIVMVMVMVMMVVIFVTMMTMTEMMTILMISGREAHTWYVALGNDRTRRPTAI